MKFTSTSHEPRTVSGVRGVIAPAGEDGDTFDVDPARASQFVGQCGEGGNYTPADPAAIAAVQAYLDELAAAAAAADDQVGGEPVDQAEAADAAPAPTPAARKRAPAKAAATKAAATTTKGK